MHRNYPKHTLFENHWFRYIIWAPDLRNHQKLTDSSRFVIKRTECAAKCLIIGICSSLVIFRYLMFLTWVISVTSTSQFYCRGESFTNKSELVHHTVYRSNGSAFSHLLTDRAEGVDPSFPTLRSACKMSALLRLPYIFISNNQVFLWFLERNQENFSKKHSSLL